MEVKAVVELIFSQVDKVLPRYGHLVHENLDLEITE